MFHSSPALQRDVGGMNSRSRAAPRKAAEPAAGAGADRREKTVDEKEQRKKEKAERDVRFALYHCVYCAHRNYILCFCVILFLIGRHRRFSVAAICISLASH